MEQQTNPPENLDTNAIWQTIYKPERTDLTPTILTEIQSDVRDHLTSTYPNIDIKEVKIDFGESPFDIALKAKFHDPSISEKTIEIHVPLVYMGVSKGT